jgi:hypothetical protein
MPITHLGGPTVIYPVCRVDQHEPLNALVVVIVLLTAVTLVALVP